VASAIVVVLGTLVIFTFEPCPTGADPSLLPTFCEAL
jgi:succinate dehydrogenase / fumarate reductase membrane anchor subunit